MSSSQPTNFANDGNNIGIQTGSLIANGSINVTQQTQDALPQLQFAVNAFFNWHEKQKEPSCLKDTRTELLDRIYSWAEGHDKHHIFWLCGLAGTGKTTIARTVARHYYDKQPLQYHEKHSFAASFFFSRGGGDAGHARRFVTTIAIQLAAKIPALKQYVSDALLSQSDIANQALRDQWRHLVHDPLSKLRNDGPATLILVIDALDECEDPEDIQIIIQLLSSAQLYPVVQLRLLLTSRPEMPIREAFSKLSVEQHNILPADDGQDVSIFLKSSLRAIAERSRQPIDWPGKDAIDQLCQSASGLFIWAATVCLYISKGQKKKFVNTRLQTILQSSSPGLEPEKQLDRIYNTVLASSIPKLSEEEKDDFRSQLRCVLGAIVVLLSPLSVLSLSELLESGDVVPEDELDDILEDLHAILDVPADRTLPLRLHHPSFRDFLLHETRCHADFRVEEKLANSLVWKSCIRLMSSSLKQDICEVKSHGTLVIDVQSEEIDRYIPTELQYACSYWIQHLVKSGDQMSDGDQVHSFLQEHLLHWFEVLGWIGKVSEGVYAIVTLESMSVTSNCPELYKFVHDIKRFALYFRSAIEQAPLQVYCSGLVFAPNKSLLKQQFEGKMPKWIVKPPSVESNWSMLLQTLEGHFSCIFVLAFSSNGKILASGSLDYTIKLWDVQTGAILQTLEGHTGLITMVAFTPYDSKVLASASEDKTVKIWDVGTGELLRTFSSSSKWTTVLTFSPDHKVLAFVSDPGTVELWDWEHKKRLNLREYGPNEVKEIVFSRNGRALALVSDQRKFKLMDVYKNAEVYAGECYGENTVAISSHCEILTSVSTDGGLMIWNAYTATIIKIPKAHIGVVFGLHLSPNGRLLVSTSWDGTVSLWDTGTGVLIQTLKGHLFDISIQAFSPDNKMVVFISGKSLKLWKANTGAVVHALEGHAGPARTVAFSPNSNVLAAGSEDGGVKLLEVGIDELSQKFQENSAGVDDMIFSPDGKMLASATGGFAPGDHAIKLWDTCTGEALCTLKVHSGRSNPVAFSYDSKLLASEHQDGTIKIWDINNGACLRTFARHPHNVTSLAFSHDSGLLASSHVPRLLASSSEGNTIKIWNVSRGSYLKILESHSYEAIEMVFSPNNEVLASRSNEKTIKLWEVHTGKLLHTLTGHSSDVLAVAFSPNGKMLASSSSDKTVKLWNTDTAGLIRTLTSHSTYIGKVAFSPDGMILVSASWDRTVKLWDVHQGKLLKNISVNSLVTTLSFSKDAAFLHTNRGTLSTGFLIPSSPQQENLAEVFVGGQWLFYQGSRRLWLPSEYRATSVAVYDRVVALGHASGRVSFMTIAP